MKRYTARLKCNPPLGTLPVLQYVPPQQLTIDDSYQRSIDTAIGQTLIRKIAAFWNWDLCQPLVVSRRAVAGSPGDDRLFVIDGQHRLEAARLRGDIHQLPCVVVSYADAAAEAASFVQLNQLRRPLNALEVFKAAMASGDVEARAIGAAMADAGLVLASHSNWISWKPEMVANIGGIQRSWRQFGERATRMALTAIGRSWEGAVKQYAGTIFPGVARLCSTIDPGDLELLIVLLDGADQKEWRADINRARADDIGLNWTRAAEQVVAQAWAEFCEAE